MNEISPETLKQRLVSGERMAVIDIREADEFNDWHIHGSTNLPLFDAIHENRQSEIQKTLETVTVDTPIVTVCRSGATSQVATEILRALGREAYSLTGGIRDWSTAWTEAPIELKSAPDATLIQIRRNGKGCLSYLAGSNGKAAVVDPCLDVEVYTSVAARLRLEITHVLETHVHADHISRARALAEATGAALCIYENSRVQFEYEKLSAGQELQIGDLTIRVIFTPGHTSESVCYEINGDVLLSGDTLFLEAIGRPDLEKGDEGAEAGARLLHDSLHGRVLNLDPNVLVCPGHTSDPIGFDGKPLVETLSRITSQIDLIQLDREPFARAVPALIGKKPPNFLRVIEINEGRMELGRMNPLELEAGPNRCAVKR